MVIQLRIIFLLSLVHLLLCGVSFAEGTLSKPHIAFFGSEGLRSVVLLPEEGLERTVDYSDLMDWGPKFTIVLPQFAGAEWHNLKARQRNSRCVSLQAEGPHIDLESWKKQKTDWKELTSDFGSTRWTGLEFSEDEYGPLPSLTKKEIEEQVGKNELSLKIARDCHAAPQSCFLDCLSEIEFYRISPHGKEQLILKISIPIPMGC